MKRKICVVVTARASYSRIKTALKHIHEHPLLTLQLVVSGSAVLDKYGSVLDQIQKDGLPLMTYFSNVMEGSNPADATKTVALALIELSTFFNQHKPDAVVTIADRFETLATATAAAYMNIPLVHIQGGEISGNIDDKVRNAITQLADYHFVATDNASLRVQGMGAKADQVYHTGCPSIDIAREVLQKPALDFNPFSDYGGVGISFNVREPYLVVMQHPVTTEYHLAGQQIGQTLNALEVLNIPAFWFWPNQDPGTDGISRALRAYREQNPGARIRFFKTMDAVHFLQLLKNSLCLIGNSSVGIRECASLGIPVVNIGSRQAGRERAINVEDVTYRTEEILKAIRKQITHGHYLPDPLYGNGKSGVFIAELLAQIPLSNPANHGK